MKKRGLSLFVGICLLFSLEGIVHAQAADFPENNEAVVRFSDVPQTHWAKDSIDWAAERSITNGCGDGIFCPEDKVSNAQFCAFLIRAFYPELSVTGGSKWWHPWVAQAKELGLLEGTDLGKALSNENGDIEAELEISRYDMAQMIYQVLINKGANLPGGEKRLEARKEIADWDWLNASYRLAVENCYALQILNGFQDGTFGGHDSMSRAQGCAVIQRLWSVLETAPENAAQETPHIGKSYLDGNIVRTDPSTGIWTGWQGRNYGAEVESAEELFQELKKCMDGYPKRISFFSPKRLEIDEAKLLAPYEYSHGLSQRIHELSYRMVEFPPSATVWNTPDEKYYEYRIELRYGAPGIIRMYREGIIDELPEYRDTLYEGEFGEGEKADFRPLLELIEEIESYYKVDRNSSEFDRALACYCWIKEKVVYDSYQLSIPHGAPIIEYFAAYPYPNQINYVISSKKGICGDTATLYWALCCSMGVNCVQIGNGNHAWNCVQIDGTWYQADPTAQGGFREEERAVAPATFSDFLVAQPDLATRDEGIYFGIEGSPSDYPNDWMTPFVEEMKRRNRESIIGTDSFEDGSGEYIPSKSYNSPNEYELQPGNVYNTPTDRFIYDDGVDFFTLEVIGGNTLHWFGEHYKESLFPNREPTYLGLYTQNEILAKKETVGDTLSPEGGAFDLYLTFSDSDIAELRREYVSVPNAASVALYYEVLFTYEGKRNGGISFPLQTSGCYSVDLVPYGDEGNEIRFVLRTSTEPRTYWP